MRNGQVIPAVSRDEELRGDRLQRYTIANYQG